MLITHDKGYAFELVVNAFPDVRTGADECAVGVRVRSPRSTFTMGPRAVSRYVVAGIILHLRAMLDGLVEVADPESEDGFVTFGDLLLSIRQVPGPDADLVVEVAVRECGCGDGLDFTHATYLQVAAERSAFAAQVDALERAARQGNPIRQPVR